MKSKRQITDTEKNLKIHNASLRREIIALKDGRWRKQELRRLLCQIVNLIDNSLIK